MRKSCERACGGRAWRLVAVVRVLWLFARVWSGGWRLCPGAEVFGAGVPGQEAFQRRAGEWFPAVAAAFVEVSGEPGQDVQGGHPGGRGDGPDDGGVDRKSTRLNSSHGYISYAVFCLKKKKMKNLLSLIRR